MRWQEQPRTDARSWAALKGVARGRGARRERGRVVACRIIACEEGAQLGALIHAASGAASSLAARGRSSGHGASRLAARRRSSGSSTARGQEAQLGASRLAVKRRSSEAGSSLRAGRSSGRRGSRREAKLGQLDGAAPISARRLPWRASGAAWAARLVVYRVRDPSLSRALAAVISLRRTRRMVSMSSCRLAGISR